MASLFDRVKRESSKAAFEADRLLRIRHVEGAIRDIRRQIVQQAYQIGYKAIELHKNSQLDSPELAAMCGLVQQLEQQIAEKEAEIERIRQEVAPVPLKPVPGPVIGRPAAYGHICPKCQIELPAEAVFCPQCGGPAQDMPSPVLPDSGPKCSQCSTVLPQEARFCPKCGTAAQDVPPPAAPGSALKCTQCGIAVPQETAFCPACGNKIDEQTTSDSQELLAATD